MKRNLLSKIRTFFVLIIAITFSQSLQAQISHTESFDVTSFPPTGWALQTAGGPNQLWVQRANGTFPTCLPNTGAGMARFTARNTPAGTEQYMSTPVIDYSATNGNTPTFSLWVYRDSSSTSGDSLTILVNTTNNVTGATRLGAIARSRYFVLPVNEPANGWYQYTFNIPSTFNTAANYIILNGTSQAGANIYIDDVQWDEYPTQCAGTPTAGATLASITTICGGTGNTDLSLNGGSSSNAGITFQWQSGTSATGPWTDFGTSVSTINSGTLTATTYFRCYVNCTASGLTDTSTAVEVLVSPNPNPTITVTPTGQITYCTGGAPVEIIANGALTYTWTPSATLSAATGDTVLASPTNTTNYTVTGTDAFGCVGTMNFNVNVRQAPNFIVTANRPNVCVGDTTVLHALNQGGGGFGTQYQWNPGALTGTNVTVTVSAPTTYTVVGTNQGCSKTDSVTIGIAAGVNPNFGYTINNQTVVFHDSSNSAVTWMWLYGDGNASFSQNPTYTYSSPGTYNVTLIVSNGVCAADTIVKTIVILPTGLQSINGGVSMSIFPNPAVNTATVEFTSKSAKAQITVVNTIGQVLFDKQISPASGMHFQEHIDMKNFAEGLYFVKIKTATESGIQQLIKQ